MPGFLTGTDVSLFSLIYPLYLFPNTCIDPPPPFGAGPTEPDLGIAKDRIMCRN